MYLSRALSVTVAAACLAAIPSAVGAAPQGDDPGHHDGGPPRIVICKYGLDTFDVYAAGEYDIHHASLGYGKKVCTDWGPTGPGVYDLSFAQRIASQAKLTILARLTVGKKKTARKVFEGEGVIAALVRPGETLRLDLYAKRRGGR